MQEPASLHGVRWQVEQARREAIAQRAAPEFLHSIVTGLGRGLVMVAALVGSAAFTLALAPAPPPWVLALVWVLAAAAFAAAVTIEQAVVTEAAGVSLGQGMAVYECANLLGMTIGTLGVGLLYGTAGGRALACVLATSLLLTAAVLIRPALRRVGVADRPAAGPRLGPDETPAVGAAATGTGPHEFTAGTGRHACEAHAAVYVVVQFALAVNGHSWPVEAVFDGPHDADRIWTAVFVLDTFWTLGRAALSRLRR